MATDVNTIPFFPPRSIESRLRHFSETYFKTSEDTAIFKFVDALCGDGGAGSLKKNLLIQRLSARLDTMYFGDIDNIFGNIAFLTRYPSETYAYDPSVDMLTEDQWDEVRIKDAWYRARIKDFFVACGLGGTPEGMAMMCMAALGVDCDMFDVFRFKDNYGVTEAIGRSPIAGQPYRNEYVIKPHKESLTAKEKNVLLHMTDKIKPVDSIITVDVEGLAIHYPLSIKNVSASSSYFEVRKEITGATDLSKLPAPEVLAQDIGATQAWIKPGQSVTAPTTAFSNTQEYSMYYLHNRTEWDRISKVSYDSIGPDGTRAPETPFSVFSQGSDTNWVAWPIADSPDNFPGGKNGVTPYQAPATNPNGTPYLFMYQSQQELIDELTATVIAGGGQVNDHGYALSGTVRPDTRLSWSPDSAVSVVEPVSDTTVTSPWIATQPTSGAYA